VGKTSYDAYEDGAWLMALSVYRVTGGPDKGESDDIPNTSAYMTLDDAIAALVDRALANQGKDPAPRMWYYTSPPYSADSADSSTTQFVVGGLLAAKRVYVDARYADAARVKAIDAALLAAKGSYEQYAKGGFEGNDYYGVGCGTLSSTERGFGYRASYNPSLQQSASGIWVQLAGGSTGSTAMVKNFVEWLSNRYVYTDKFASYSGPFYGGYGYWYYLWSSFKAMQLLRESGGAALADKVGSLKATDLPLCGFRQEHRKAEGDLAKYAGTPEVGSQYFDYATHIMETQCETGTFGCSANANEKNSYGGDAIRDSFAILVLQRSTGAACVDVNPKNGVCDSEEQDDENAESVKCDMNGDGNVTREDLAILAPLARAKTPVDSTNENGDVVHFVFSPGPSWWQDKTDGVINVADYTFCLFKAARRN
jgi:hypothetical protein